jgi:hypothetical protein
LTPQHGVRIDKIADGQTYKPGHPRKFRIVTASDVFNIDLLKKFQSDVPRTIYIFRLTNSLYAAFSVFVIIVLFLPLSFVMLIAHLL